MPSTPLSLTRSASATTLSSQLDAILVEFFTLFSTLRSLRAALSSQLSSGFFAFARARHDQPRLLLDSSAYVGRPMQPTVGVFTTSSPSSLTVVPLSPSPPPSPTSSSSSSSSPSSSIRQRVFTAHMSSRERRLDEFIARKGALDASAEAAIDAALARDDASEPPALDLSRAPLRWFGVMVPAGVSEGQRAFEEALRTAVEVAGVEARMRLLEERYMGSMRIKDPLWVKQVEFMAEERRKHQQSTGGEDAEEEEERGEEREEKVGKEGVQGTQDGHGEVERAADGLSALSFSTPTKPKPVSSASS